MTLKQKIRQYQKLRQQLPQLEREIRAEAMPKLREQGILATPRLERIIAQFS